MCFFTAENVPVPRPCAHEPRRLSPWLAFSFSPPSEGGLHPRAGRPFAPSFVSFSFFFFPLNSQTYQGPFWGGAVGGWSPPAPGSTAPGRVLPREVAVTPPPIPRSLRPVARPRGGRASKAKRELPLRGRSLSPGTRGPLWGESRKDGIPHPQASDFFSLYERGCRSS